MAPYRTFSRRAVQSQTRLTGKYGKGLSVPPSWEPTRPVRPWERNCTELDIPNRCPYICVPNEVKRSESHRRKVPKRTSAFNTRDGQAPELFQDEGQEPPGLPGPPSEKRRIPQRAGHGAELVAKVHPPDKACH